MPRYGSAPSAPPPPPRPPDEATSLTRWSWRARLLAVVAGVGMVAAFVFEFLPPTSAGSKKTSTTVVSPSSTTLSTAAVRATSTAPATSTTGR